MNLVDTVRGQTDPFNGGEIKAEIECQVTSVSDEGFEFTIKGQTKSDSALTNYGRTPRGIVTKVSGSATYSHAETRFEKFELVALGYRWGRTRFNGRYRGPEYNPLGFVVTLAPKDEPPNVPGLIYAYETSWLARSEASEGSNDK